MTLPIIATAARLKIFHAGDLGASPCMDDLPPCGWCGGAGDIAASVRHLRTAIAVVPPPPQPTAEALEAGILLPVLCEGCHQAFELVESLLQRNCQPRDSRLIADLVRAVRATVWRLYAHTQGRRR